MRGRLGAIAIVGTALVIGQPTAAVAEVKVERGVTYQAHHDCIRLSNGTVEVIVATAIGPRVLRYALIGGDNILGDVPDAVTKTDLGDWRPWGGHRLWTAPEGMPRSYSPDNGPVTVAVSGNTVTLTQPVEPKTGIEKVLTVTLAPTGSGVTVGHRITNTNLWTVELAPWALTILNAGGTVILPQEPYKSHDEELQPVRVMTLWAYTDLSDPRWTIGPKFLRLATDASRAASQKVGISNRQGWAAYLRNGTLFVKRVDWHPGATYPDFGVNMETYTAGNFIELETLAPLSHLEPHASATHEERWSLFPHVTAQGADDRVERALAPHLAATH
jgi:hypothetical protein